VRGSLAGLHSAFCIHHSAFPRQRRAFTLIEIMVVVVIIVLMVGLAVPVFRVINGSRSEAGASNVISAMLNRARTDAIGIQQPYGVLFVYNPNTQLTNMAEVYFAPVIGGYPTSPPTVPPFGYFSAAATGGNYLNYFINNYQAPETYTPTVFAQLNPTGVGGPPLEIVPDTDVVPLPLGIGVQTICNCNYSGSNRTSNGYLSIGVILFDAKGRIVSMPYGISKRGKLAQATGISGFIDPNAIGYPYLGAGSGGINTYDAYGNIIGGGAHSQFGLVIYQNDAYLSHRASQQPEAVYTDPNSTNTSPLTHYTTGSPTQQQADLWLDQNATPLIINRYTGTLIKGE
jgi:prepilin-type N-terminal cleavage/methylation domain-containing protein